MAGVRVLTQTEREEVLQNVKPFGQFKMPKERKPFGSEPIPWEQRLGNLDEWRKHPGMGRAIVKKLADPAKTQSVQNSIGNRLRRLYPNESWSTYVDAEYVFLKFGGLKRQYKREDGGTPSEPESSLFSAVG